MSFTVLALHYWAGSGHEFEALRPLLAPGTTLLRPNLPGFGGQVAPAGFDYSVGAYADWVEAYALAHHVRDFVLLGHSMGGKVALALAARQPAGLRRLVLLSPSPPTPEPMTAADRTAALAAFGNQAAAEQTFHKITHRPLVAAQQAAVVADNLRSQRPAWDAWLQLGSRENLAAAMPALAVPCRLLVGQHDRAITPATQRRHTLPHLPAGTACTVVPGAGHLLPLEAPETVAEALR